MKLQKNIITTTMVTFASICSAATTMPFITLDSSEGSRKAVVVAGQPFYVSTGKNSSNPRTVFPFEYANYALEKIPDNTDTNDVVEMVNRRLIAYLTEEQAKEFREKLRNASMKLPECNSVKFDKWACVLKKQQEVKNVFDRFEGSLTNIVISYNFGTGYWVENLEKVNNPYKLSKDDGYYKAILKPSIDAQKEAREALIYAAKCGGGRLLTLKFAKEPLESFVLGKNQDKKLNYHLFLLGATTIPKDINYLSPQI